MIESLTVIVVVCATHAPSIYARLILYLHGYNSGKACHVPLDFAAVADCACHRGEVLEVSFLVARGVIKECFFSTTRWAGSAALSLFNFIWVENNLCVSCWSAHRCVSEQPAFRAVRRYMIRPCDAVINLQRGPRPGRVKLAPQFGSGGFVWYVSPSQSVSSSKKIANIMDLCTWLRYQSPIRLAVFKATRSCFFPERGTMRRRTGVLRSTIQLLASVRTWRLPTWNGTVHQ